MKFNSVRGGIALAEDMTRDYAVPGSSELRIWWEVPSHCSFDGLVSPTREPIYIQDVRVDNVSQLAHEDVRIPLECFSPDGLPNHVSYDRGSRVEVRLVNDEPEPVTIRLYPVYRPTRRLRESLAKEGRARSNYIIALYSSMAGRSMPEHNVNFRALTMDGYPLFNQICAHALTIKDFEHVPEAVREPLREFQAATAELESFNGEPDE